MFIVLLVRSSANVFGVSTESMQCSYVSRGNNVPTILLLMQRRLNEREGIFRRINAENSKEEYVRDQLNRVVPNAIDVHCLAGLIKDWFKELPTGVLDLVTPEQVTQCQSEEECAQVVTPICRWKCFVHRKLGQKPQDSGSRSEDFSLLPNCVNPLKVPMELLDG